MRKSTLLDTFEEIVLSILIIVVPITFLPLLYNGVDLPRQIILSTGAIVLLFVQWIRMLIYRKLDLQFSFVTLFAGSMTVLSLIGLFIHPGNPFGSLLHPFGFINMASLFIIGSVIISYSQKLEHKKHLIYMFLASGIASGILSMLWIIGQFFPASGILPIHPSGSLRFSLVTQWVPFLLCLGIIVTNKSKPKQLVFLVGTILAGILASTSLLFYIVKFQPITMPYTIGWQVALETLKTKPIQGAGVPNYEHAFTQARPSTLNVSPIWNIRFMLGPNILFHYITTFGFIGALICIIWLIGLIISSIKAKQGYLFPVTGILAYFFLFPLDITFLFAGIILTAIISPIIYHKSLSLHQPLALLGATMILPALLVIGLIYLYIPAVQTEILTRRVIDYANTKDLTSPIPLLDKARNLTPYRDDLFVLSSQFQLQLLLQKLSENGISDNEKEQIAQQFNDIINLAQQAININPLSSINWKNLADMYSQLRPYISNADVWAAQSLQESFLRDPSNAFIQAQMADILYSQGNIVRAIQVLEQAVNLKPDYPPFLYALARVYTEMKNYEDAITLLSRIKELLPASSPDIETINKDLQTLNELIAQKEQNTPDQQSQQTPQTTNANTTPSPTVSLSPSPQPSPSLSPTPSSPPPETDENATAPDIPPITMPTPTP